ncbi:hypothetical protein EIN_025670 [Entamoeba invadens IP1]|uniref:hypothetical protein n=1 Tax=Entamoeba invadens IP1 TaxID=370355 RepID=UPI0002C3F31D|nr:hypothetical protein EIN_025670 [Entamoeba invadens IP1]ELP90738.1 hypothetical protein EIN_025670 [Entamoeba invadens IP1]|eukprot:XP_004257509.1 hypothetical protein EIN_025670 [Entamoeba invadens IP1]
MEGVKKDLKEIALTMMDYELDDLEATLKGLQYNKSEVEQAIDNYSEWISQNIEKEMEEVYNKHFEEKVEIPTLPSQDVDPIIQEIKTTLSSQISNKEPTPSTITSKISDLFVEDLTEAESLFKELKDHLVD